MRAAWVVWILVAAAACGEEPSGASSADGAQGVDQPQGQAPGAASGGTPQPTTGAPSGPTGADMPGASGAGAPPTGETSADGGAGAAEPSDAGSAAGDVDGGADAGTQQPDASTAAAGCAGSDYLICEDFESTAAGGIPDGWTVRGDATVVSVTDEEARNGSHSLWIGPIEFWERRIARDASVLGAAHWGRIHYKVQLPVPDAFVHSTLVAFQGSGPVSGASEFRVVDTVKAAFDAQGIESHHQFLYNVQPQSSGEFATGTTYDWEFDGQWHCAEWHVDASSQTYLFYLDGAELIRIENGPGNYTDLDLPDGFDELRVGWNNYQHAPPGFTAWLDDLAIDHERVGCD
jgi:hypothetical protein